MKLAEDSPSNFESEATAEVTIEGIASPVVRRYFEALNAGNFQATAALFAEAGALSPPFEEEVVGRDAIATYLEAQALGMILSPRQGIAETLEDRQTQVQVTGKVQTRWFGVNVSWLFLLSPDNEIISVTIKLLASPQELLNLKRS